MEIVLDPRDVFEALPTMTWQLCYPPAAILFAPLHGPFVKIPGLPPAIVPIFPSTKMFKLGVKNVKMRPIRGPCTQGDCRGGYKTILS